MKEFIDKLIGKLEEELKLADEVKEKCARENPLMFDNAKGYATGISNAKYIVNQLAEKYNLKPKEITNADKIRAMTDEELAEYIVPRSFDCSDVCSEFRNGCMYNCAHGGGREFILKWLQSEAE